ncbi:helicase-exonuclease AddAB subunit AddA [Faecalimonas sp.]
MGVNWTPEQKKVISLRNRNILVSAAAGSGKTAVLVERIITMLTEDDPPLNVDELLSVTFTEAAAAEMKERILLAIEKKLEENPNNIHLQKQSTLIHSAMITTIHSFCLSVIREYFHTIDLDPSFRIGEEGELKLLQKEVLQELLEEQYMEADEKFLDFVERFATGKDDNKLEELILQLYMFSESYPNSEKWLDSCVDTYDVQTLEEFACTDYCKKAIENIRKYATDAIDLLEAGVVVCEEPEGPYMYKETLENEIEGWKAFLKSDNLLEFYEKRKYPEGERLKPNRDKTVSEELSVFVKGIRKQTKEILSDLIKTYLFQPIEEMIIDMSKTKKMIEELTFLVKEFSRLYTEEKRKRNLIDFGDMEHLALQILTVEEGDVLLPSPVAKEYQKRFKEIMIDEYQDSNLIQEAILTSVSTMSCGRNNIFMVGDVKQSIYRFRLSRPELFMEKFDTYNIEDSDKQRIDLHKNFRSRGEVLDSTNFIFEQIMTKGLGKVEYDDRAALYVGADYKEKEGNETEVLIVDVEKDVESEEQAEETVRELEARAVSRRIKELMAEHQVQDKVTGELRQICYKDIVILTRSLKGWTDVFAKILNREGIPTYTGSKEGYFETQEIQTILNYLRILDNPNQDIPLASVLTSRIGKISGEELSEIRILDKEVSFYCCVKRYIKEGGNLLLVNRLKKIFEQIEYFREMIPYTAIHELLWRVIEETGYGYEIAVMAGGEQRKANLEMLLEKAKVFEGTSYKGLFNFIRYMEQLKKYDVDYGEANIADEQADAVRLMSIHKSKGLEFPIVFVAGMNKRFNKQDITGEIVTHAEFGIGLDRIDLEKRMKSPTFLKKVIQREVMLENIGEELRILYVALTRAKEKLIMTGTLSQIEKKMQGYEALENNREKQLPFTMLSKAASYFDWVLPAILRYPEHKRVGKVKVIGLEELVQKEVEEEIGATYTKEKLQNLDMNQIFVPEFKEKLEEQFAYQYPYANENHLKLKFTVSELKKRKNFQEEEGELLVKEEEVVPILPKVLMEEEGVKGALKGTTYHKVLELLDFSKQYTYESMDIYLENLVIEGRISKEMKDCVRIKDLLCFLETDIAKRMKKCEEKGELFREQPFVLGVSAKEIYPKEETDETLLIQGIIDVWMEEEEGLVVVDYKTDRVKSVEELKERYESQLKYYGEALEKLTGKKVKEKIMYSLFLQREIYV